jgi:hypothetical protein
MITGTGYLFKKHENCMKPDVGSGFGPKSSGSATLRECSNIRISEIIPGIKAYKNNDISFRIPYLPVV